MMRSMTFGSSGNLLDLLGVESPIVQAPMAGVSTPEMAAAVSNAGALGSIGVGATNAENARQMIRAFRERSRRSLNVNVFCHFDLRFRADAAREAQWIELLRSEFARFDAKPPSSLREIYRSFIEDDDMLAMLVAERPRVVSFHFGVPSAERVRAMKDAGIVLLGSATSLSEAKALAAAGCDAIVAQGYEAGGHRGVFDVDADDDRLGTFALVRVLAREIERPILAARNHGRRRHRGCIAAWRECRAARRRVHALYLESLADAGYRTALAQERRCAPYSS